MQRDIEDLMRVPFGNILQPFDVHFLNYNSSLKVHISFVIFKTHYLDYIV